MKADKLLAEWFWTDRWRGSSAALLPLGPRGLYREMLTEAWRRGARLPNNHEAIQRAVGATAEEWAQYWPQVERYWRVAGEWLINDTQVEVYQETVGLSKVRAVVGRRGGLAKAANSKAKVLAKPQANNVAKPYSPSPSPSPSLTLTENERTNDGRPPAAGWVARVLALWPGVVKAGHIGGVLKPVMVKYGEEPMLRGLIRWLESGAARFGPEVFAREAEAWISGTGRTQQGNGAPKTAADVTVNAMKTILAREDARDREQAVHGRPGGDSAPTQQAGVSGTARRLPPRAG